MRAPAETNWIAASLIAALAAMVTGCSTVGSSSIDPVESRTQVLFGQVQFDLQLQDVVLLNPYFDQANPKADAFEDASNELFAAAELLVGYSIDLIDLARGSDEENVGPFVTRLRSFHESVLDLPGVARHMNDINIDAISRSAAEQKNLLRALRAAAPVHDSVAEAIRELILEADDLLQEASDEIYGKISDEFDNFTSYADNLFFRQDEVLEKLLLVDSGREGDTESWQSLLAGDDRLRDQLGRDAAPTPAAIDDAEAALNARLASLSTTWGYLEPTYTSYQALLKELYAAEASANHALQVASLVIESWDKAQRQLTEGEPARFISVTQDLLGLAIQRRLRSAVR